MVGECGGQRFDGRSRPLGKKTQRGNTNACIDAIIKYTTKQRQVDDQSQEKNDGNIITIGAEDFHCAKVLLQPSLLGKGASGNEVRH